MLQLLILGPIEVRDAARPVALGLRRAERLILGVLLLEAGRSVSAERLIDLLWDADPPKAPSRALQTCISRLRARLDPKRDGSSGFRLVTTAQGFAIHANPDLVDAYRFQQMVHTASTQAESSKRVQTLRDALALWRGPLLYGAATERQRDEIGLGLAELRKQAQEDLVEALLATGAHQVALPEITELVARTPWNESLVGSLMLALYRSKRQTDALEVYRKTRLRLADELGVEPGPALRELHQRVLMQDPSLERPAPQGGSVAWDAPAPVADFVGRCDELAAISAQLSRCLDSGVAPIVAISGLPGVGKTALALKAAHQLRQRFPAGQLYIDLHGHGDRRSPELVLHRFLRALGLSGQEIPTDLEEAADTLRRRLSGAPRMILLDNAASVSQLSALLPPPECAVLVTSRSMLADLDGALFLALKPMPEVDAVDLLARALGREAVSRHRSAAVEVVNTCGRLPLAVRIAAAQAIKSGIALPELADRLTDHTRLLDHLTSAERSVRASMQSAYVSLADVDQRLLRSLAAVTIDDFPGWVSHVALGVPPSDGQAALTRLVSASLVERSVDYLPKRFRLHDIVRVFAAEQTTDQESGLVLDRVASAWNTLAEEADKAVNQVTEPNVLVTTADAIAPTDLHLEDPEQWYVLEGQSLVWLARLTAERGLHALSWHLVWNCETYLRRNARTDELLSLCRLALASAEQIGDRLGTACISLTLAASLDLAGDTENAYTSARRAVRIADEIGHRWLQAESRSVLADISYHRGMMSDVRLLLRQAVDLYEQTGELRWGAVRLTRLAELAAMDYDDATATADYERGVTLLRRDGAPTPLAHALRRLAVFRRDLGQFEIARDLYVECLQLLQQAADPIALLCLNAELALTLLDLDDIDAAHVHVGLALELAERVTAARVYVDYAHYVDAVLQWRQGRLEQGRNLLIAAIPGLTDRPPLQVRALLDLTKLQLEAGDRTAATAAAATAIHVAERIGYTRLARAAQTLID